MPLLFQLSILKVHLNSAHTQHSPAVHLFSLRVAPILEYLHVIEEQANAIVCLVQLPLHLCCVLSWFPCVQQTDVLEERKPIKVLILALFLVGHAHQDTKNVNDSDWKMHSCDFFFPFVH